MRIELPIGRQIQSLNLPDSWKIDLISADEIKNLPDSESAFMDALDNPVDSRPLSALLPERGNILIMLSDITRKDGKKVLLSYLLGYLNKYGIKNERVHLMFCRGTHREMTQKELEEMIGAETLHSHTYFQHDCDGPSKEIGITSHGTPVALNSRLWDYSLLIPISGIVHHYFAGFGGGRKMLIPGAASRITIQKSHSLIFTREDDKIIRRQGVESARLDGNAIHEDFVEAAQMLDIPVFLIAVIPGKKDASGQVYFAGIWAGDLFKAHEKACRVNLDWKGCSFNEPYDLVFSSSGGYPLDNNLVQSHKGLDNAFRLVKPDGFIIHLAACPEGLGESDLESWINMRDLDEMKENLIRDYRIYGQTMYTFKDKASRAKIYFVSNLPDDTVKKLNMLPASSLKEAFDAVLPQLPQNVSAAFFPEAGNLLPLRK